MDPALGEAEFSQIHRPLVIDGQRASALRIDSDRVRALLAACLVLHLLPRGFTHHDLREHIAPLLGLRLSQFTRGRMTYDLRRLRLHGLIERIRRSRRYRVTSFGYRSAMFLTRAYGRLLRPGLAVLAGPDPPAPAALRSAIRTVEQAIDALARRRVRSASLITSVCEQSRHDDGSGRIATPKIGGRASGSRPCIQHCLPRFAIGERPLANAREYAHAPPII